MLALALGKTVRQLQLEIDSAEFSEWIAYSEISPFGELRSDLRTGILAATVSNMVSKKKFVPSDFMPDFGKAFATRQDDEEMKTRLRLAFARGSNGDTSKPNG